MKLIKFLLCTILTIILLDIGSANAQTQTVTANTVQANKVLYLSGNKADSITNDANFTTNSTTHLVTQYAIKAYVDNKVLFGDTTYLIYADNTGQSRIAYGSHDSLYFKTLSGSGGIVVSTTDSGHILINCVSCGAGSSAPTNSGSGQRLYHLGANTISTLVFPTNSYLKADSTTNVGSITVVLDTTAGKAATKTDINNIIFGIHGTVGQFTYLTAQGQVYTTGVVMDSVFNQYTFPRKIYIAWGSGISQNTVNDGLILQNATPTTNTNAEYGPKISSIGQWWNSGASASQQLGFGWYSKPTAGTITPTGTLHIEWEWNGNTPISVGDITNNGGLIFANGTLGTLYAGVTPVSGNGASVYVGGTASTQGNGALKFKDVSLVTTPESGLFEYKNGYAMLTDSDIVAHTNTRDTIATRGWARTLGGLGGSPGGSSTQIQVNVGGSFGAYSTFTYNGTTFTVSGSGSDIVDITGTGAARNALHLQNTNSAGDGEYYVENDRGSFASFGELQYGGSASSGTLVGVNKADKLFLVADGASNLGLVIGTTQAQPIRFAVNNAEVGRIFGNGHLVLGSSPTDNGGYIEVPVATSSAAQFIFDQGTTDVSSGLIDGMVWYNHTAHALNFRDNSTTYNLLASTSPTGVRFIAPNGFIPPDYPGNNDPLPANKIHVVMFYLPYTIAVNNLRVNVTTNVAASTVQMGIYDASGNKVCATSTISSATTGLKTGSVSGPITLTPGFYWEAYVSSDAGVNVSGYNNPGDANWDTSFIGEATNVVSGGIMPSTLGTITTNDGSVGSNPPLITILH